MNIEQRLAKLERTSRYWRFTAVALGLTLVAITAMGLADDADQIPDVIKARRFEVVNEQGIPQVSLWHAREGGAAWNVAGLQGGSQRYGQDILLEQG